jgi:pimeloyl-ACP methyl ester carboxylesterase
VAAWQSGDVVANGIKIHYHRTGGGRPPLVLSHGATDNGLCWTRLAGALESDFDVIMPDARGHGLSDAPEQGYGGAERAADLAAFIGALVLERPAVGGHSMGAGTTLRLVADHPGLASCAILEDPGFRDAPPSEAEQADRAARMREQAAARRAASRQALIDQCRTDNPTWAEEELGPWAEAKQQVSLSFAGGLRLAERPDWRELLPKVSCPVLLITADPERGGIVTPEIAAEAARLAPDLEVVRLPGAGHNVRREQFDAYLGAVRAFLARVGAGALTG